MVEVDKGMFGNEKEQSRLVQPTLIDTSRMTLRYSKISKQESLFQAAREGHTSIDGITFNSRAFETTPNVTPEVLQSIIFEPMILHQRGESAHDVQGARIQVELSDGTIVEKLGIVKFHPSVRQEFRNTLDAREKGMHTTNPLVALSMGNTETGDNLECLILELDPNLLSSSVLNHSFWLEENEEEKLPNSQVFLGKTAKEFGKMHARGMIHNDPHMRNIALDISDTSISPFLFDWESRTTVSDAMLPTSLYPSERIIIPGKPPKDTFADDVQMFGRDFFNVVSAKKEMVSYALPQKPSGEGSVTAENRPQTFGMRLDNDVKKLVNIFNANLQENSELRSSIKDMPSFFAAFEQTLLASFSQEKATTMIKIIQSKLKFDQSRSWNMLRKQFSGIESEENKLSTHLQDQGKKSNALLQNFKQLGALAGIRESLINWTLNDYWSEFRTNFLENYYTTIAGENSQLYQQINEKQEEFEAYIKLKVLADVKET